jgi:quercetin dioxygenase-like cupin family protein
MSTITIPAPLIRNAADAERRWFYGGGIVTWLAKAEDTAGTFLLTETEMVQGKVTPLHTHPAEESMYVLEGEILMHMDGDESIVRTGGMTIAPRGVPHAFKVLSPVARVLALQTPGTCQAFYMGASEPIGPEVHSGPVDFDRITESGRLNGGFELVGPPPFPSD